MDLICDFLWRCTEVHRGRPHILHILIKSAASIHFTYKCWNNMTCGIFFVSRLLLHLILLVLFLHFFGLPAIRRFQAKEVRTSDEMLVRFPDHPLVKWVGESDHSNIDPANKRLISYSTAMTNLLAGDGGEDEKKYRRDSSSCHHSGCQRTKNASWMERWFWWNRLVSEKERKPNRGGVHWRAYFQEARCYQRRIMGLGFRVNHE